MSRGPHNGRVGAYGFYQHDDVLFGLQSSSGVALSQAQTPTGHVQVAFAEDQYAATDRLTLNGGVRVTRFSGGITRVRSRPTRGRGDARAGM